MPRPKVVGDGCKILLRFELVSGNDTARWCRLNWHWDLLKRGRLRLTQPIASDGQQDFCAGFDRTTDRAANLTDANSSSILGRNLGSAKLGLCGFDLHLNRPAKIRVAHPKRTKRAVSDRPKWTQVRIFASKQYSHQKASQLVTEKALGRHRTRLSPTQKARSQYKVKTILSDRLNQLRKLLGMIAVISIEEHNDFGGFSISANPRKQACPYPRWGSSITTAPPSAAT